MALRRIKADLHVHTCLSPCSSLDMSPREVVNAALEKGLDLIGVCDHNSAENALAVKKAGSRNGLMVLGGMEVTSSEEAHLLVFFEDDDDLLGFQEFIYRHLAGTNDEHAFGMQVVADDEDGVTGFCDRLLIGATSLPAEAIVAAARRARLPPPAPAASPPPTPASRRRKPTASRRSRPSPRSPSSPAICAPAPATQSSKLSRCRAVAATPLLSPIQGTARPTASGTSARAAMRPRYSILRANSQA